ncbi:MAG: TRAP transporter small permease [Beijerinckiaceae bacterium]
MPIKERIMWVIEAIVVLVACTIVVLTIYQVCARSFDWSIRWIEELTRLVCIWGVFLATAILVKHHSLIKIDFFVALFPERVRIAMAYVETGLIALTFVFVGLLTLHQVRDTWRLTSPGLEWPMGLFTLPIGLGFLFSLIYLGDYVAKEIAVIRGQVVQLGESMI